MTPPERSPDRDAAIAAMLPLVPLTGWTVRTLTDAAGRDADLLFSSNSADMVEAYIDWADRQMEQEASLIGLEVLRLPERVRAVIALRLQQARPHKEAVRRAMGVLALPGNAAIAARTAARTVDAIWHAAGDTSADFSWYTKRAILLGVYGTTLLYWLRDDSDEDERTLAFLDRRLAGVGRIGKLRRRVDDALSRFRPAAA